MPSSKEVHMPNHQSFLTRRFAAVLVLALVGLSTPALASTGPGMPFPKVVLTAQSGSYEGSQGNNSVYFTAVFNQRVRGFSSDDVQIWGTANPQSVEVSGSGAAYTVRVSGMNASGSVYAQVRERAAVNPMGLPSSASNTAYTAYTFSVCTAVGDLGTNALLTKC